MDHHVPEQFFADDSVPLLRLVVDVLVHCSVVEWRFAGMKLKLKLKPALRINAVILIASLMDA